MEDGFVIDPIPEDFPWPKFYSRLGWTLALIIHIKENKNANNYTRFSIIDTANDT